MKNMKLLRLVNQIFFSLALLLGLSVFAPTALSAQGDSDMIPVLEQRRDSYTNIQQTFAPGSAKWDLVGDVIEHLDNVIQKIEFNNSYLSLTDRYDIDVRNNPIWKKVDLGILQNFTPSELAAMQTNYSYLTQQGETGTKMYEKLGLILQANAY